MLLQLAIDQPDALPVVRQVADLVDIVEVGTPLLKRFGLASISGIRELAPNVPVLVDTETVDGGVLEAEMVFHAGATFMTTLACSHMATLDAAAVVAEKYGTYVVFDTLAGGADRLDPAAPYSGRGRIVALHAGFGRREHRHASIAENRVKVASVRARGFGVSFAGGIDPTNLAYHVESGPDVIVVGRAVSTAPDPRGAAEWMRSRLPQPGHGWSWEPRSSAS
ncbi:MAG: orotidine 5'-phosphate decarboxylase [Deinococcales bacterium]|jgi:3-hexulose-6-phosphate synthase